MAYKKSEIKKGINMHCIETTKFKTNFITIFLTVPMERKTITKNTLIPAILKRGTNLLKTQEEINIELEEMYGATFDCGIDKTGDNQILKFYLEVLNDKFALTKENILKKAINLILDIVFNPYIENESFNQNYVETEKENIKNLILSKIDNKDKYALERCIEEMYKGKVYGLYKYGYEEDLKEIQPKDLYQYYLDLINTAKIDIFISGEINETETLKLLKQNENIKKLKERTPKIIINNEETEIKEETEPKEIKESKDITQGKLVIGLDVAFNQKNSKYQTAIYNVILGESATSKLFQNVREKASLAYTARSNYVRQKNNIYIRCGIEIEKYEQALKIIKEQIADMENGNFTEEDLENAKKYMVAGIRTVQDEQDSEITYYFGQELSGEFTNFEQYIERINAVTKENVLDIAKNIKINTIYFLKN